MSDITGNLTAKILDFKQNTYTKNDKTISSWRILLDNFNANYTGEMIFPMTLSDDLVKALRLPDPTEANKYKNRSCILEVEIYTFKGTLRPLVKGIKIIS